ncbi:laminin-like protein lam-2 [Watersipora subatra]|uniref:laminin-like protein lam-2 n=1 Tax=Watersipora subatra TaxID=2589382 RepID=UPI00355C51EE
MCPPSTQGPLCERCIPDHWGWNPTGCEPCDCNPIGSRVTQCDSFTGDCSCMSGVTGAKCDSCLTGFYNFTADGCTECNCSALGSVGDTCNNVSGQCFCKENVIGRLCDQCNHSSFYLDGEDNSGCTPCYCSGAGVDCDSYLLDVPQVFLDLSSATVSLLNFSSISREFSIESNTSITVDSSLSYLRVISPGGDNLLLYYGSNLEVTYTTTPVLVPDVQLNFYIQSSSNELIVAQMNVTKGVYPSLPLRILLRESQWWAATGDRVSRVKFLEVFSTADSIYFPLNVGEGSIRISDAKLVPTNQSPLLVERCECQEGYTGLSCEACDFGYTRHAVLNHSKGVCLTCDCNGYASECSPTSGECINCLNNTAGFFCDLCLPGYYGGAFHDYEQGCSPCPCYAPGSESMQCDIVNGSVTCESCKDGYTGDLCNQCEERRWFNGTHCNLCECSGNSLTCNYSTGECIACENNSKGWHCDACVEGYHGYAAFQNCTECYCDSVGSVNQLCDSLTGQCECRNNVETTSCAECTPGYWNFSSQGCSQCQCDPTGSVSEVCDVLTGLCLCKTNATGSQCELCALGSFGLPEQECQDCDCNMTGSYDSIPSCDAYTGACNCREGVTGRKCDQCLDMFDNFTSSGCTVSGIQEQARRLLADTNELASIFTANYNSLRSSASAYLIAAEELKNSTQMSYDALTDIYEEVKEVSQSLQLLSNLTLMSDARKNTLDEELSAYLLTWQGYESHDRRLGEELILASELELFVSGYVEILESYNTNSTRVKEEVLNIHNISAACVAQYMRLDSAVAKLSLLISEATLDTDNTSSLYNSTQILAEDGDLVYESAIASINSSTILLEAAFLQHFSNQQDTQEIALSQKQLNRSLEETRQDLNSVSQRFNESLTMLAEAELKVDTLRQAVLDVTSLVANVSSAASPSLTLYYSYINASRHIQQQAKTMMELNFTLSIYADILEESSLSHLAASLKHSETSLQPLNITSLSINSTRSDLQNLTSVYQQLATVWEEKREVIANTSSTLDSTTSSFVNHSDLATQILGSPQAEALGIFLIFRRIEQLSSTVSFKDAVYLLIRLYSKSTV